MKNTGLVLLASLVVVMVGALAPGCTGSGRTGGHPDTGGGGYDAGLMRDTGIVSDSGGGPRDMGVGPTDSGGGPRDTGPTGTDSGRRDGGMCVPSCTSDTQCQTSCPPRTGGGISCCDTATGTCYASTMSMCPSSSGDAGTMMY